jgi:hypothetical protein
MGIVSNARSFSLSWVDSLRVNLAGGLTSGREIRPFGTQTEAAANRDQLLPPAAWLGPSFVGRHSALAQQAVSRTQTTCLTLAQLASV